MLKNAFPKNYEYISLDEIQTRNFALNDPKGFLNAFKGRVIIDDVNFAPSLIQHIKNKIDENSIAGMYILSGRLDSDMKKNISLLLSGRAVKLTLLPFSLSELANAGRLPKTVSEWMVKGNYPELSSAVIESQGFFHVYISAFIEHDIKGAKIQDRGKFRRFLAILAANCGNPINLSKLSEEMGIDARTVNSWIRILEENHILFRLAPCHAYFGKKYTKTPKLYFYDAGLLCFLLGINSAEELSFHRMRNQIFETAIISEIAKKHFNAGYRPRMYYWRDLDNSDKEVDLIVESTQMLELIEIKLSQTANEDYAKSIRNIPLLPEILASGKKITKQIIYDGNETLVFEDIPYANWKSLSG
jgi:hypothetical protein